MSALRTYKLVPLGGDCGTQHVDGYKDAREIAQDIAQRNHTEVVVSDSAGRAIVWGPDGSHRALCTSELDHIR
jgi:hypothetical protein